MTALEIAECFDLYACDHKPDGYPAIRQDTLNNAASMLRRQHEAIVKLRNAAKAIIDYGNSREAAIADWPEWDTKYDALEQALKDTEDLK